MATAYQGADSGYDAPDDGRGVSFTKAQYATLQQIADAGAVPGAGKLELMTRLGRVRMSAGSLGNSISADPLRWWEYLCLQSNGRFVVGKNASVAGNTTQAIIDRMATDWPAQTADIAFHQECTNDFGAGGSPAVSYAQHSINVRAIFNYLLSVGTLPIAVFPPPRNSNPTGLARMGLCDYAIARELGIPIIFPWRSFVNTTTGAYTTEAGAGDGIHPSRAASVIAGLDGLNQLKDSGLVPLLPLSQVDGAGQRTTNCLFLTDTNADGLADGWVTYGDPSVAQSLSAGTGDVKGNWQVLQANGTTLRVWELNMPTTGIQAGDVLLLSVRLKVEMLAGSAQCTVQLKQFVGGTEFGTPITPGSNVADVPECVVQREITAVAGITGLQFVVSTNVASARCSVAQLQVYNLTGATR